MKRQLLIIDDDKNFINDTIVLLKRDFECSSAESIKEAVQLMQLVQPDVILLDLMLKNGENGIDGITIFKKEQPSVPIVMITDYSSIDTAVKAVRMGAFEYISKSIKVAELKLIIERALEIRNLKIRTKIIEDELAGKFQELIGESPAMEKLRNQINLFASNDSTILITGESGVGKELVTRQIHYKGNRKNEPFVVVNCAAIPKELIESELFGHEKGAFTGAAERKIGKFELAGEGTIFLDEISELDLKSQVALLRVLQEKEFQRVGGVRMLNSKCRVIAATNKNLIELVNNNLFRDDLYYRLDVLPIAVPSLRERKEDISLLIKHFIKKVSLDMKIPAKPLNESSIKILGIYNWPGNIRELSNITTRAVILSQNKDEIDFSVIKEFFKRNEIENEDIPSSWDEMLERRKIESNKAARKVEELFITDLLQKHDGNIVKAAKSINVERSTIHKILKRIKLQEDIPI